MKHRIQYTVGASLTVHTLTTDLGDIGDAENAVACHLYTIAPELAKPTHFKVLDVRPCIGRWD